MLESIEDYLDKRSVHEIINSFKSPAPRDNNSSRYGKRSKILDDVSNEDERVKEFSTFVNTNN